MVELPKPLQPGEEHRFGLSLRMPRHMLKLPHCLMTPETQCDRFDLTVRFYNVNLPDWICGVHGETVRMFEIRGPSGSCSSLTRPERSTRSSVTLPCTWATESSWAPAGEDCPRMPQAGPSEDGPPAPTAITPATRQLPQ